MDQRRYQRRFHPYMTPSSALGRRTMGFTPMQIDNGSARSGYVSSNRGRRFGRGGGRYRDPFRALSTRSYPVWPVPESKGTVATLSPVPITNTGTIAVVNSIAQGLGQEERIGLQVSNNKVTWQFYVANGATPLPSIVRHMLVWDRQPNGGTALVGDILDTTVSSAVIAPNNLANKHRFVILANERFSLSPNGDQIIAFQGKRTLNQISEYADGGSAPLTGALLVLLISNQAVAGNQPVLNGTWRIRYKDN